MKAVCASLAILTLASGCLTTSTGSGDDGRATANADEKINIPAPPDGYLKYTVTVSEFKNEAGWAGHWHIGNGFKTIMTDVLNQSGWFITLGDSEMRSAALREQDLAASGRTAQGKKTPVIGQMTPAQLLVRGSVTHVQKPGGQSGGLNFKGFSIGGGGGHVDINMTIYLVDSTTGQVIASDRITANSKSKGMKIGYYGGGLGGLTGNVGGEKNDNMGIAAENAVAKATAFLIKQLESVPWEGTVISNQDGKIMINRGTREGVKQGQTFRVGNTKIVRDPDTGEVLDVDVDEITKITVTRTKEKLSYASSPDASKVKKGMTIVP